MQMTYKKDWMRRLTMPRITMTDEHIPSYHSLPDKGCPSLTAQEEFGSLGCYGTDYTTSPTWCIQLQEQCTGILTNTCVRDRSTNLTQNALQQIWRYQARLKPMCMHLYNPMYIMHQLVCKQNQQQPSV